MRVPVNVHFVWGVRVHNLALARLNTQFTATRTRTRHPHTRRDATIWDETRSNVGDGLNEDRTLTIV